LWTLTQKIGASRLGVWTIKHIVAPLDRLTFRLTGRPWFGARVAPVPLLTTRGRRSGRAHVTPLIYLREAGRFVVCNVNPGFERINPWVLNLDAHPEAEIGLGGRRQRVVARKATVGEVEAYWPRLLAIWPAYQEFYSRGGKRTIFVLEPDPGQTEP
jgi:deazaflavin-dependent oxidoreductase (nitroreductase family)